MAAANIRQGVDLYGKIACRRRSGIMSTRNGVARMQVAKDSVVFGGVRFNGDRIV
jgi:hypothetical protein